MSVNLLLPTEETPVIWRGPVLANMVKQFWSDVMWGEIDYLFVDITNSFTGEIIKSNNIYKTVKSNERYCGIGLFNIEKIVEKYNGEMSITHDANTFNVSIILSLLEQDKA